MKVDMGAEPFHALPDRIRLEVSNLQVSANTPDGRVQILAGVNFRVAQGETIGLVGESGCGKSTTARAIMGILPVPPFRVDSGSIKFEGRDLLSLSRANLNVIRGRELSMIFQDPNTSLNPMFTVGDQMEAVLLWQGRSVRPFAHSRRRRNEARERAAEMLDRVRLPAPRQILDRYPFQLSGGMRQRVLIAISLLNDPKLIVADEPGSALDVTIQDQIMELLESLMVERGLSLVFITHNLGVARRLAQHVAVMYAGQVVETATTREVFERPLHPYTQGLLASVPKLSGKAAMGIPGRIPDNANPPTGCQFHPRCPYRMPVCEQVNPPAVETEPGHVVACHLYPVQTTPVADAP